MIRGMSIKDIAAELNINIKTIHSYRSRLFQKLDVDTDLGFTLLAVFHGLLILEPTNNGTV